MSRRLIAAVFCLLPLLAACGLPGEPPTPTPRPRAEQIAQLAQVAAAQEASAVARAATQAARAQPTATATVPPTVVPTLAPTTARPATRTALPTTTPRPPTVAPVAPGTAALPFFDPLTDPASGWLAGPAGRTYAPDGFHLRIDRLGSWGEVPNPALLELGDVSVEVDITNLTAATPGNGFGILCRYHDSQNWYGLTFSADGYYLISRMRGGAEIGLGARSARRGRHPARSCRRPAPPPGCARTASATP